MNNLRLDQYFSSVRDQFSLYTSDPEDNNCEHRHEFNELVIVESGHGLHVINGKPHFIQEGDVFFVKDGDCHFYDELGTLRLINVLINRQQPFQWLNNVGALLARFDATQPGSYHWLLPQTKAQCKQMIGQLFSGQQTRHEETNSGWREACFFQLLMNMACQQDEHTKSQTKYKLHKLLGFLQQHCFEEIDWEALSDRFYLSKRTLQRQIKETTGLTPDNYIKRLRLVSAREKIINTEESITYIAYLCGFANSNHFSTCYKQVFGQTPSQQRSMR